MEDGFLMGLLRGRIGAPMEDAPQPEPEPVPEPEPQPVPLRLHIYLKQAPNLVDVAIPGLAADGIPTLMKVARADGYLLLPAGGCVPWENIHAVFVVNDQGQPDMTNVEVLRR